MIALVVGDLGYSVVLSLCRPSFPARFINAGVAEQNMTGLAAGMASEGYHVFTYSIANFPTLPLRWSRSATTSTTTAYRSRWCRWAAAWPMVRSATPIMRSRTMR